VRFLCVLSFSCRFIGIPMAHKCMIYIGIGNHKNKSETQNDVLLISRFRVRVLEGSPLLHLVFFRNFLVLIHRESPMSLKVPHRSDGAAPGAGTYRAPCRFQTGGGSAACSYRSRLTEKSAGVVPRSLSAFGNSARVTSAAAICAIAGEVWIP